MLVNKLTSLRSKFLVGLLSITLLLVIVGIFTAFLFKEVEWVSKLKDNVNKLDVLTLNLIKIDNDFFDYEATNENYFLTGKSTFLTKRDSLILLIEKKIHSIKELQKEKKIQIKEKLDLIDSIYQSYNLNFDKLEKLVYRRGYKDFGMEGKMRLHAHALELPQSGILSSEILMLRRAEKDFLLRHDTIYSHQFNVRIRQIVQQLEQDSGHHTASLFHIKKYQSEFESRVEVEKIIGLTSNTGLRSDLNQLTHSLSRHFILLTEYTDEIYNEILRSVALIYLVAIVTAVVISWLSSLWLSQKLSAPIVRLTKWVDGSQNNADGNEFGVSNDGGEINLLTQSFVNLIKRTRKQMNEIEEKSMLIDNKNQELVKLNHELDNFLYSTAHDLRSPLSSLSGLVRLMRIENQQQPLELYLDMMDNNIRRQEEFISQIVSYAKNSKLGIMPEKLDLQALILTIFQNHEFIDGAAGIQKYVSVEREVPFFSDISRITIIFNNLISNAIRYADPAKGAECFIEIKIKITAEAASIRFSDNGVGIDSEYLDKIFNMFYRANVNSKGSGLGLFILKEAVHKLCGSVEVTSKVNAGTTFVLEIPNLYKELVHTEQREVVQEFS